MTDPESGDVKLAPLNGCSVLTRQIVTICLVNGIAIFCFGYVYSNGVDFLKYLTDLTMANSVTGSISYMGYQHYVPMVTFW